MHQYEEKVNVSVICSIGAAFDFYAGTQNRTTEWLLKLGLEWLHRLVLNPRRLWKRNFVSIPVFIVDVLKAKFFGQE